MKKSDFFLSHLDPLDLNSFVFQNFLIALSKDGSFRNKIKSFSPLSTSFRAYQPYDPVSKIHWRSYAKTDQLLIREDQELARGSILIAIDFSLSMHWPIDHHEKNMMTKAIQALKIGFHIGLSHLKNGDSVEYIFLQKEKEHFSFLPKTLDEGIEFYNVLIIHIKNLKQIDFFKKFQTNMEICYEKNKTIIYGITDCLDEDILNNIFDLGENSKKSILFQVLSSQELDFSWTEKKSFYKADHLISSSSIYEAYQGQVLQKDQTQKKIHDWIQSIHKKLPHYFFSKIFLASDQTPISLYTSFLEESIDEWA